MDGLRGLIVVVIQPRIPIPNLRLSFRIKPAAVDTAACHRFQPPKNAVNADHAELGCGPMQSANGSHRTRQPSSHLSISRRASCRKVAQGAVRFAHPAVGHDAPSRRIAGTKPSARATRAAAGHLATIWSCRLRARRGRAAQDHAACAQHTQQHALIGRPQHAERRYQIVGLRIAERCTAAMFTNRCAELGLSR